MRQLLAILIASVSLTSCKTKGDGEQVPSNLPESAQGQPKTVAGRVAEGFVEARDRFITDMNKRLADLDTKIATLKNDLAANASERKAEANLALSDAIAKLEAKRQDAQRMLDQAKSASADQWERVKNETDETLKRIEDSYREVGDQLRR